MLSVKAKVLNKRVCQNDVLSLLITPQKIVYYELLTAQIIGIIECNEGEMKFLESIPVVLKVKDTLCNDLKVSIYLPHDIPPSYASDNYKINYFFVINSLSQVFYKLEFFVYKTLSDAINYTSVKIIEQDYYRIEEIVKSDFCDGGGLRQDASLCKVKGVYEDDDANDSKNNPVSATESNDDASLTDSQGFCVVKSVYEDKNASDRKTNPVSATESNDDASLTDLQEYCKVKGFYKDNNASDSKNNPVFAKALAEEEIVSDNKRHSETRKDACDIGSISDAKTHCKDRECIESKDINNQAVKHNIKDEHKNNAFVKGKSEENSVRMIAKGQNAGSTTKEQYYRNFFYEHVKDIDFTKDQTKYDKLNLLNQRLKAAKYAQDIPYFKYMNDLEKYKKKVNLRVDQNTRLFSVKQDEDVFYEVRVSNKFETNQNNEFTIRYYQNVSKTKVILKRVEKRKGFGLDLEHVMHEKVHNTSFCSYKIFSIPIEKISYHTVNCFYFSSTFLLVIELDDREIELPINIDQCAKTL